MLTLSLETTPGVVTPRAENLFQCRDRPLDKKKKTFGKKREKFFSYLPISLSHIFAVHRIHLCAHTFMRVYILAQCVQYVMWIENKIKSRA